jgi:hypothetical protein
MKCLECSKDLEQTVGKRAKQFCNSTCRSNYWQKAKRKIKENNKPENKKRILEERNKVSVKNLTPQINESDFTIDTTKHPLWKENDPKENSGAFFMKYDCNNYDELENKLKNQK